MMCDCSKAVREARKAALEEAARCIECEADAMVSAGHSAIFRAVAARIRARSATESAQDGDRREREVRRECHCPAEEHDFGCFHAWSNADSGLDGA